MQEGNVFTGVCLLTGGYPSLWYLVLSRGCPRCDTPKQGYPPHRTRTVVQRGLPAGFGLSHFIFLTENHLQTDEDHWGCSSDKGTGSSSGSTLEQHRITDGFTVNIVIEPEKEINLT